MAVKKFGPITVNLNFDFINPDRIFDSKTSNAVGRELRKQTIAALSRGQSPVKGQKRLQRYKDPDKYPGKRKSKRPVNLKLSGNFYNSLGFKKKKDGVLFGITKKIGKLGKRAGPAKNYMHVHNAGFPIGKNGPRTRRAWLPLQGEEYNISIIRELREIISLRLNELIRRSNKK